MSLWGIEITKVDRETPGFESQSFDTCAATARERFAHEDDQSFAIMKCDLRHKVGGRGHAPGGLGGAPESVP